MNHEPVAVLIPTFNRARIVTECIRALRAHLIYTNRDDAIHFYVGCDGDDDTQKTLAHNFPSVSVTVLEGPRRGLGANLNMLLKRAATDGYRFVIQLDDDHILTRPIHLQPHVEYLANQQEEGEANNTAWAAWVRLMGVGGHAYTGVLKDSHWFIQWNSNELYIPSNRPHLKNLKFHTYFGLYPEGVKLGPTEEGFCHQCRDKALQYLSFGMPYVVVPLNSQSETAWEHVGDSWQGKGK